MNSNKFIPILGLLILLILAIGSISASDVDSEIMGGFANIDLTVTEPAVNEISDSGIVENLGTYNAIANEDEVIDEGVSSVDSIDDEINSGAIDNLGASNGADNLASTITFTESDYSTYFSSNGNIISGKLKSGDTLDFSGKFTNKTFIINIPLVITSSDGTAQLFDCGFSFINGSSGSSISNMKMNNSVADRSLISMSDVNNMILRNNNLFRPFQRLIG